MRRILTSTLLGIAGIVCLAGLLLWKVVQGGTCGPAEGGGTCGTTAAQVVLGVAAVVLVLAAGANLFRARRP